MPFDLNELLPMVNGGQPQAAPPPNAVPQYGIVAPHASPDNPSGDPLKGATNLSDEDYRRVQQGLPPLNAPQGNPSGKPPSENGGKEAPLDLNSLVPMVNGGAPAPPTAAHDTTPANSDITPTQPRQTPTQPTPPAAPAPQKPAVPVPDFINGTANAATHALTFGLDDPVAAGAGALADWALRGKPFGQAYDQNLADIRASREAFEQAHPVASSVSGLLGGIGSMGGGLAKTATGAIAPMRSLADALFTQAPAGATLPQRALAFGQNLAAGTALGGAAGFGAGQGGFQQRLEGAIPGAAFGFGLGAAAPALGLVGSWAGNGVRNAYNAVAPLVSQGARETAIGNRLVDAVGNARIEQAPLPNVPLNLAQATNNQNAGGLAQSAQRFDKTGTQTLMTQQNKGVRAALSGPGGLSSGASRADSSAQFTNALRNAEELSGAEGRRLWNAPELTQTRVQTHWAKNSLTDAENDLRSSDPGLAAVLDHSPMVRKQLDALQAFPKDAPIRSLNSIRSQLLAMARAPATDPAAYMQRRVAQYFAGKLMDAIDRTISASTVSPAVKQAYSAARAFTAKEAPLFGTQDAAHALGTTKGGLFRVDASKGADGFFDFARGSSEGAENVRDIAAHLDAIEAEWNKLGPKSGMPLRELQEARSALVSGARDFIVSSFTKAIELTGRDDGIDRLNFPKAVDWLDTNKGWMKKSGLFTPDQIDVIDRLYKTVGMLARPTRTGTNSVTAEELATGKYLDNLLSPWIKRIGYAAGVVLGYHTEGALGAIGGGAIAHGLERLTEPAKEALKELMFSAIRDTQIAKDLMMKASNGNTKFLSPQTKALLARVTPALIGQSAGEKVKPSKDVVEHDASP